jgi:hypothetical protein
MSIFTGINQKKTKGWATCQYTLKICGLWQLNNNLEDTRRRTPEGEAHLAAARAAALEARAPALVGPPISLPFYVSAKPLLRINRLHWFKSV